MEKKNTGLIVLVIVLVLLVLGLGGHIVYDKVMNPETMDVCVTASNDYTYSNMSGYYKATDNVTSDNGESNEITWELYLWEDGTFRLITRYFTPTGYYGNYTIVDNKIKLNYMFSSGSGEGLTATKGEKEIDITSDKVLKTNNDNKNIAFDKDIILTKEIENEKNFPEGTIIDLSKESLINDRNK